MRDQRSRAQLCVIYCIAVLTVACSAQKPDDWALNNAMIGPDSPIEIRAGSTYQARAMYPVPDGPLFPFKQKVAWSIEPAVQGIAVDADGNIHVAADVLHGTTALVHADLKSGRRKLSEKIFVYRPEKNPLVGVWQVGTRVICGNSQEIKAIPNSSLLSLNASWKFNVNQQFWVGKEHNIAGGIYLAGTYQLDVNASEVRLTPTSPQKRPSKWQYLFKDGSNTLILQPMEPQDDLEPGCGYILSR